MRTHYLDRTVQRSGRVVRSFHLGPQLLAGGNVEETGIIHSTADIATVRHGRYQGVVDGVSPLSVGARLAHCRPCRPHVNGVASGIVARRVFDTDFFGCGGGGLVGQDGDGGNGGRGPKGEKKEQVEGGEERHGQSYSLQLPTQW